MGNILTETAPKVIYLQVSDEVEDHDQEFPYVQDCVTWYSESVLNCEVKYIRADLVEDK